MWVNGEDLTVGAGKWIDEIRKAQERWRRNKPARPARPPAPVPQVPIAPEATDDDVLAPYAPPAPQPNAAAIAASVEDGIVNALMRFFQLDETARAFLVALLRQRDRDTVAVFCDWLEDQGRQDEADRVRAAHSPS